MFRLLSVFLVSPMVALLASSAANGHNAAPMTSVASVEPTPSSAMAMSMSMTVTAAAVTALPSPSRKPNAPGPVSIPPPPPPDKIFSYSQPALPSQTAVRDPAAWMLKTHLGRGYKTRYYDFKLSYAAGSPSGFERRMTTVNAQFPGPLIEANVGDWIEVKVTNDLDHPQALHWHG